MNNKVKDIIDHLIKYKNEDKEMKYQPEDILTIEDVWLLLDYISNLQQKNKQLKEEIKKYINSNDFVYDELYKKRERIEKILGDKEND